MKKAITTFLLLIVVFTNVNAQVKEMGIGLLEVNTSTDIELYKSCIDTLPAEIIHIKQMKDARMIYKCNITLSPYEMSEGMTDIEAEEMKNSGLVDFGPILKFKVIQESPLYYQVVVNEEKGAKYYIKKRAEAVYHTSQKDFTASRKSDSFNVDWFIYETWEEYLRRAEFIELKTLKIYEQPNGEIIFSSESYDFLPFKVERVEGEWMKLIKDPLRTFNFEHGINYEGWYQWKDGNKWCIYITEFTIE